MIVEHANDCLPTALNLEIRSPTTMHAALLIGPEGLALSPNAAKDNLYLKTDEVIDIDRAHKQHANLERSIRQLDVPVMLFAGRPEQPDGCFGNNVYGTTSDRLIIGHMYHPDRQTESKRTDVRDAFLDVMKRTIIDLSEQDCVAELTGCLVIDRGRGFGICGLSTRADPAGASLMNDGFQLNMSLATPLKSSEYHTNIVLALLASRACVIAPASFENDDATRVVHALYKGNVIEIDDHQKASFVANCIAVTPQDVMMSQRAAESLRAKELTQIEGAGFKIHAVDVSEFEKAGGSLRCLVTEIF